MRKSGQNRPIRRAGAGIRQKSRACISALSFIAALGFSVCAFAASCKNYATCEDAVIAWCAGEHPRADGDHDGIPCENVCSSKAQVDTIREKIGCKK